MKKINKGALKRKAKSLAKKVLYKGKTRGRVLAKKAVKRFFVEGKKLKAIIRKELKDILKEEKKKKTKKKKR